MTYYLVDAEQRSRENPGFQIPAEYYRTNLQKNDLAKLVFKDTKENFERMWVMVTGKEGDTYTGTLNNHPVSIEGLNFEDEVKFKSFHVIDVIKASL